MSMERAGTTSSLVDVLDRVLDKGIAIDAWVRLSLGVIDLAASAARIVVASIDVGTKFGPPAPKRPEPPAPPEGPAPIGARLKWPPGSLGGAALPPRAGPEPDAEPPLRRRIA